MVDRYTKIVLSVIAVSLAALAVEHAAPPANAQGSASLSGIENNLQNIANGVCVNRKICG